MTWLIILLSSSIAFADFKVGVMDTGVQSQNPYLKKQVSSKFFSDDKKFPEDLDGHGTHISGLIIQNQPKISILPIQIQKNQEEVLWGTLESRLINGLYFAIENKVKIINLSFVYRQTSAFELAIWHKVQSAGIIVVVSAGNNGEEINNENPIYPCSHNLENIICVGSSKDKISSFSNFGPAIDFWANGEAVVGLSLKIDDPLTIESGTSQATAIVSNKIADVWIKNPKKKDKEILSILRKKYPKSLIKD